MRFRSMKIMRLTVTGFGLAALVLLGNQCGQGLSFQALVELQNAGVNQYVGEFTPFT